MAFGRLMNDALRRNVELVPPDQNGLHDLLFRRRPMGAWIAVEIQIGIGWKSSCRDRLSGLQPNLFVKLASRGADVRPLFAPVPGTAG
jgi:hypothetical protein